MFGSIGIAEMVLIAGVALVVIGPDKFPDFAKVVLRTVRDIRGYVDDVRDEVTKEVRPIQREIRSLSKYDPESYLDKVTKSGSKGETKKPEAGSEGFTDSFAAHHEGGNDPEQDESRFDYDTSDHSYYEGYEGDEPIPPGGEPQPGEDHASKGYDGEEAPVDGAEEPDSDGREDWDGIDPNQAPPRMDG